MIFEVGRGYRIVTGIGKQQGSCHYTVLEVSLPLIKVEGAGLTTIFNTASAEFVSAQLDDEEARAVAKAEHERFMESLEGKAQERRRAETNEKIKAHNRGAGRFLA